MVMLKSFAFIAVFFVAGIAQGLEVGQIPPSLTLEGKAGGRVDGSPWSSSELMGKVHSVFYVDPDKKKVNAHVEKALKKEEFPRDRYHSTAIINMRATWMPSFILGGILKKKQAEFTTTTFVKDKKKSLVKNWNLQDNSYNVLLFGRDGKLLYSKSTKFTDSDVADLITIVRGNL